MARKRTVLRSSKGKKLYAVREASGKFEDIQSYQRAQSMDIKRVSKAEGKKKAAKKTAKKKSTKKRATKKGARKSAKKK